MSRTIKELITKEFLSCKICNGEFQNPKILKCLHTFCEACILSTIRHQRLNSSSDDISCPVCRTRIETNSYDELNLQTNDPVQKLLEMIQGSPHNESFVELYRVKLELNLNWDQVVAISDKNRCVYLQRNVDDLRNAVIGLRKELTEEKSNIDELQTTLSGLRRELTEERRRSCYLQESNTTLQASTSDLGRELTEYKKQLTSEKDVTAKLKEQLVERDQTIGNLRKLARDTENQFSELKVQKENLEKVIDELKNSSLTNQCITYIGKCLSSICQASVSWLPKWFQRKREETKRS
ncbi:tripartite motif-containing protein 3-like [Mercenaria mercenaria]|uniref:tripartite motif-containing protein 3-like n=1 Tax=Mercenaria mercenaria TaxID=6596 RepID=UPI00234E7FDE|nr:tripartite motif-containing protein 3-like [Mercenaria mercenaria]